MELCVSLDCYTEAGWMQCTEKNYQKAVNDYGQFLGPPVLQAVGTLLEF